MEACTFSQDEVLDEKKKKFVLMFQSWILNLFIIVYGHMVFLFFTNFYVYFSSIMSLSIRILVYANYVNFWLASWPSCLVILGWTRDLYLIHGSTFVHSIDIDSIIENSIYF
jgi:hypothetical protein